MGGVLSSPFSIFSNYNNERDENNYSHQIALEESEFSFLHQIYQNNGFDPILTPEQYFHKKMKHAKNYHFPISISSNIYFEKDILSITKYFISFKYSSKYDFDLVIFLNAEEDFQHKFSERDFFPSKFFREVIEKKNVKGGGNNLLFLEKDCFIDLEKYNENKLFDKDYYDLIIECLTKQNKYKLAIYCRIISCYNYNNSNNENYKIKPIKSKICLKDIWFDSQAVFGLENENSDISNRNTIISEDNNEKKNLCEACLTNEKNVIFLPCMHSYTCENCTVNVRLTRNKCPLCREKIKETVCIDKIMREKNNKEKG